MANIQKSDVGIYNLLKISLPLMLGSLSAMAMIFVDRMLLVRYSLEAHNAVVEAINLCWAFILGISVLTGITQVFVAQNYGAGFRGHALSSPIWQMIWLSLGSCFIFWPLSWWGAPLFFGTDSSHEMQRVYFSWMILFVPFHGIFNALAGYFIGQGNTRLPSLVILFGNIMNMTLALLLIFGVKGLIPSLGIVGAAIGLNSSLLFQVATLLWFFFKEANFKGKEWKLKVSLLFQCLKVGTPNALFTVLEAVGWSLFYFMMGGLSEFHLTVTGIIQSLLILFFFVGDGLLRAVSALSGNAIGSKQYDLVPLIIRNAFVIMTSFAMILAFALFSAHNFIVGWFVNALPEETQILLYPTLLFGLGNLVIYKYFEGIRLIIAGALTAAADTVFLMIAGTLSIWVFMITPIYFLVYRTNGSVELALILCSVYTILSALLYLGRFLSGKWKERTLLVTH